MARKKTVTITTDADELELPGTNPDAQTGEEVDVFDSLRVLGLEGQLRFNVYKISGKPGSQLGYCQSFSPSEFSIEAVRDSWGGGKFQLKAVGDKGKIVKYMTFDVMEPTRPPVASTPSLMSQLAEIKPLLELIHPPAPQNNNELLLAFMKSQGELMSTIMNRQPPAAPPPLSIADVLQVFQAMKPANSKDPVEMLMDGLKMGRELSGDGGGTDMLDIASKGLDVVREMAHQNPQPAPRPRINTRISPVPGASPAITGNVPAQPAPAAAAPTNEELSMPASIMRQLNWLKQQVNLLVYQAGRSSDPALYADVLLDNLPPFITVAEIETRLGSETAINDLASIDKRVETHRAWFEEFRRQLLESINDMVDDEPASDEPPGGVIEGGTDMENLA